MKLTDSQQAAVDHRGSNLLLAASAGSGKTEVLARRCVSLITDPDHPCRIDQLLVVTFTRAAAAELRARIGKMLRQAAYETEDARLRDHLWRQEILVETAEIGTIDGWCARIVREHFAATDAGVDPAFAILGMEQAALLRNEVLDSLFEWIYSGQEPPAVAARDWMMRGSRPSDEFLRNFVLELNRYREHLINPGWWFDRQLELYQRDDTEIRYDAAAMLAEALADECGFQRDQLGGVIERLESAAVRENLEQYSETIALWARRLKDVAEIESVAADVATYKLPRKPPGISEHDAALLDEVKKRWFEDRLKKHWDSEIVGGILDCSSAAARLVVTLLGIERRYNELLEAAKAARGACEFGDVLRLALNLLGTPTEDQRRTPTEIARRLQDRYEHILIDEYQDTSPVQVELLRLVSREEAGRTNRFMVGDIKQSIYGFREAEPRLFSSLAEALNCGHEDGDVLLLTDNFRSHGMLLDGLNLMFASLFDSKLGGTSYTGEEQLRALRDEIENPTLDGQPRIEVQIVQEPSKRGCDDSGNTDPDELPLERIEREGRIAAARIRAMLAGGAQVPERDKGGNVCLRPMVLGDIVILLRATKGNAPRLAAVLREAGVPCVAAGRESILDSLEVLDVRNALSLLVNRRQDLPLASYLRGPMVGLSARQLLEIRRAEPEADFFTAVEAYLTGGADRTLLEQLSFGLGQLDRWTKAARTQSLTAVLRQVLRDTGQLLFAAALPGGEHRVAMLHAFERLAAEFGVSRQQGLPEFVAYLDELIEQDVRPDATAATSENVVRIMTIHASKGLEFPIVFLLGAGTSFSRRPRGGGLACDEQRGIGLEFFDFPARTRIRSAACNLNRQAAKQSELEEELRLLYVATTRARERLVIVGHASENAWENLNHRYRGGDRGLPLISRLCAASMLEWVLMCVANQRLVGASPNSRPLVDLCDHAVVDEESAEQPITSSDDEVIGDTAEAKLSSEDLEWIDQARVAIQSRFDDATASRPAVLSVSTVKQQAMRSEVAEVPLSLDVPADFREPSFAKTARLTDGRVIGDAYHRFLQLADFRRLALPEDVRDQLERLRNSEHLTDDEAGLISIDDITWFAGTEEGSRLIAGAENCRREVPFVYALPIADAEDRTVMRGTIDLLYDGPDGLEIFDYKTDQPRDQVDWARRVAGYTVQLQLYAQAARDIFQRSVTDVGLIFLQERRVIHVPVEAPGLAALLAQIGGGEVSESG